MPIRYSPLLKSQREIRLLRVLKCHNSNHDSGDSIECTLEHASIRKHAAYTSLSYTWGDPTVTENIVLDGEPCPVIVNLYHALRYLRSDTEDIILWVDAVCINQNDDEEKSWQVQQMSDIYASARLVVVWLGLEAEESDIAMEKLATFGAAVMDKNIVQIWQLREWAITWAPEILVATGIDRPNIAEQELEEILAGISVSDSVDATIPYSATKALLMRSWWQRVWVVQELVFAGDVVFSCGAKKIGFEPLAAALTVFRLYHLASIGALHSGPFNFTGTLDPRPYMMLSMKMIQKLNLGQLHKPQLALLLQVLCPYSRNERRLNSTDPRDYVFAFLALSSDAERLGLAADYKKPCSEVYTEFLRAHGNQPHLLSLCQFPKWQNDLPSWVPDWSASSRGRALLGHEFGPDKLIMTGVLPPFEAAKDLNLQGSLNQGNPRILRLHGIIVDEINCVLSDDDRLRYCRSWDEIERRKPINATLSVLIRRGDMATEDAKAIVSKEIRNNPPVNRDGTILESGYFTQIYFPNGRNSTYALVRYIFEKNIEDGLKLARAITDAGKRLVSAEESVYGTASLREEAIWRTMVADQQADDEDHWNRPTTAHYYVINLERCMSEHPTGFPSNEEIRDFHISARVQRAYDKLSEWDIIEDLKLDDVRAVFYAPDSE